MNRRSPIVLIAAALGNMLGQRHAQENKAAARRAKSLLSSQSMAMIGIGAPPPPTAAFYPTTARPGWRAEARRRKHKELAIRRRRNARR